MLGLLWKFSPRFVLISFFIKLLKIYDTGISIFLIRYLINTIIYKEKTISQAFCRLFILCLGEICIATFNSYYNNMFLPKEQIRFRQKFHEQLFQKVQKREYAQYDKPEYYDKYSYVISEAENRIFSVYDSIRDCGVEIVQVCFIFSKIRF